MSKTRIVFWGSPGIAATFLEHLIRDHASQFEITAVVTQTPKTIQRQGKSEVRSAVHNKAEELKIPVFTPKSVKKEAEVLLPELTQIGFDLFVVLAYGKILPQSIIDAPRLKSVNFHGSLLPLLRGASPIEHSLLNGFTETGWTLQRIVPDLDAGDIVAQSKVAIEPSDTTGILYEKLSADLLLHGAQMLRDYISGHVNIRSQEHSLATHCGKIAAEDGKIDFQRSAMEIHNKARAFTPRPGVFAFFRAKKVKLTFSPLVATRNGASLHMAYQRHEAGQLSRPSVNVLGVTCGDGQILEISSVTPEGKKTMSAGDFINGYRITGEDKLT